MNFPSIAALFILLFPAFLAGQRQKVISEKSEYCCAPRFSATSAIALARSLAKSDNGTVKRYFLSDSREDQRLRGSVTDRSFESFATEYLAEVAKPRHVALYLKTPAGEAIDFWDGFGQTFERRLLGGANPFILSPGVEIVFMGTSMSGPSVFCRTRAPVTEVTGRELLGRIALLLGTAEGIRVEWDDAPWFFDELPFPVFLPVLAWSGPPPKVARPSRGYCWLRGGQVSCLR
jgi:hypothetical protein